MTRFYEGFVACSQIQIDLRLTRLMEELKMGKFDEDGKTSSNDSRSMIKDRQ